MRAFSVNSRDVKRWLKATGCGRSLLAVLLVTATACSKLTYYTETEDRLDTSGYYHVLDHVSAYYPSGIALNFPGYIVAFEESATHQVTTDLDDVALLESADSAGYTVERLLEAMNFDVNYVSLVMRYRGRAFGEGNCSLYSLYHNREISAVEPCSDDPRNGMSQANDMSRAYADSWDALDILGEQLARDLASGDYTHLVVAVMGLDTAQEEAIRNYKSIISSIRKNAGDEFKPLFVGVTWPSFYANRWFDPLWEALAYPPIADRADTIGLSWLGILFSDVILPLSDRIEVTVVAHSFGARAATMALCVGPMLSRGDGVEPASSDRYQVENFIGLAAAFSLERFRQNSNIFYEDIYYRDFCPRVKRFVFTASYNDHAFLPVFWSESVGDHEFMRKFCAAEQPVSLSCTQADASGEIEAFDTSVKVNYIDTSLLMKYTMPGTEGGGHSDIYRLETGRLLWTLIDGGAP